MKFKQLFLGLALICSVNVQALSLPGIAQPLIALKCLVDVAKLKKDLKDFNKNHGPASCKKADKGEQSDELVNLNPNSNWHTAAKACDLLIDTAAILAASYLLYDSFNTSLRPKLA